MHRSRRALLVASVVAATAATLAGCSKDSGTSVQSGQADPTSTTAGGQSAPASQTPRRAGGLGRLAPAATAEYLSEVATRTTEVDSGRYTYTMSVEGTGSGPFLEVTGAFDNPTQTSQSTVSLPGLSELLGGTELGAGGLDSLLGGLGGTTETLTQGTTAYLKTPEGLVVGGQPVTTPWVSYTTTGGGSTDLSQGLVPFAGGGSPKGAVESLRGAGADLKEVGTETIDGVTTYHLAGTMDLAKAAAAADPAAAAQLQQLGRGSAQVDVWVDEDGIVRKQDIAFDFGGLGGGAGAFGGSGAGAGKATFSLTFTDVNQPVDIRIPPADQVTPVSESDLTSGLLGGLGDLGGFDN